MSQVLLSPLPPLCATMGHQEFPQRLLASAAPGSARMLNVGLLNLMPNKDVTERQWLRLLLKAEHPHPVKLHLLKLASWRPTHANPMHMARYYTTIEHSLAANQLDMLMITGAPLGRLEYADVRYWAELSALMCELEVRAIPTLFSCWAAQAALHHLYQVPTLRRQTKLSGVFAQQVSTSTTTNALTQRMLCALNDFASASLTAEPRTLSPLPMPQSRFALPDPEVLQQRLAASQHQPSAQGLHALLTGDATGASVLSDARKNRLFFLGHPEYEDNTLALEYARDLASDPKTKPPLHYQLPEQLPAARPGNQPASYSGNAQPVTGEPASAQWQALGAVILRQWLAQGQTLIR